MPYDHRCTIAVPLALLPLAASIGRAMDPDIGGAASFDTLRATDSAGAVWAVCDTPCVAEFAAQAVAMLNSPPPLLLYAVRQDYAARWPDLPVPSESDCDEFRAAARVQAGPQAELTLSQALGAMGLTLVQPEAAE